MVEATVALRNGDVMVVYADNFADLFTDLAEQELDVMRITGKTIKLKDMRQGKGTLKNG